MNLSLSHPGPGWARSAQCRTRRLLLAVLPVMALCACAGRPALYDWGAYQPAVYNYLKQEETDYARDVAALEANMHRNRPPGQQLPPGFQAHLGMLYLKMGQSGQGMEQFAQEKRAFPEAAAFMDFLMRNAAVPGGKAASGGSDSVGRPSATPDGASASPAGAGAQAARTPAGGEPAARIPAVRIPAVRKPGATPPSPEAP